MPPIINKTIRSRWFAGCVHAGMWLLLVLALVHLGGRIPEVREANATGTRLQSLAPVGGLDRLFSPGVWPKTLVPTNTLSPFFTGHFIPAAPPPPTTRKIEVTYQGFYQTGDGPKQTMFKLGNAYEVAVIGARIATNLFIANATVEAMTLTNLTAQTNILPLNTKKELEVPIK
ncbi:MAG TPA: hypothetical protein P5205_10690 [Candidatus Paceibacterota bacterium]|nr:hypothetical protein [Verrucomicrobiota bacterium]HSA10823.1 hypothetical protein [Candidatus Paceibacterota bacterium]